MLARASARLAAAEWYCAGLLLCVVFALLLLNVVTRSLGTPLIWVDELAIYVMIWAALIGASIGIRNRDHIAMTLVTDLLPAGSRRALLIGVDVALLVFFAIFGVILWNWFDPVGVLSAETLSGFSQTSFNFIYEEPTTTIGMRKVWFWLILPVFFVSGTVHASANLATRLRGGEGKP
ncbi:TRAP dicarboxylate transporter subunit DctQ [Nitratireductor pacificus pht-3B]|uniref:TRAP transporter small permease protein n=1 Tax=Nitratireductor pacificus pht-3B TaxID=391937 RepID=K2MAK5_9HYPH|nr:TRAP dicarboxylate transporter subunit DctQ [Nitratireductor pacificus pht-3B]